MPLAALKQVELGLPSIGGRRGAFEVDEDTKRRAHLAMAKLDDIVGLDGGEESKAAGEGQSMADMFRAKREAAEKVVEESKAAGEGSAKQESVDERKKRL